MKLFDIVNLDWREKIKSGTIRILKLGNVPSEDSKYFEGFYLCLIEFRKVPTSGFPFAFSIGIEDGLYFPIPAITLEIFLWKVGLDIHLFHEG
tara:strand:- start:185 stop:463 length:279 start_codon:yes stop_codon:yes gene_type:complete